MGTLAGPDGAHIREVLLYVFIDIRKNMKYLDILQNELIFKSVVFGTGGKYG